MLFRHAHSHVGTPQAHVFGLLNSALPRAFSLHLIPLEIPWLIGCRLLLEVVSKQDNFVLSLILHILKAYNTVKMFVKTIVIVFTCALAAIATPAEKRTCGQEAEQKCGNGASSASAVVVSHSILRPRPHQYWARLH
jgi:hypothetical protein